MEDSSHSTPSPMSSAASSQDSLHRNAQNAAAMAAMAAAHQQHQLQQQNYQNYYQQQQQAMMHQQYPGGPGGLPGVGTGSKKKGVKSTFNRIFGKKDKQLKALKVAGGAYVTGPMVGSPGSDTGGFIGGVGGQIGSHPAYSGGPGGECDIPLSESVGTGLGGLAGKGDFDRRKKKK